MSTIRGHVMLFVAPSLWFPWEYMRHWDYPGHSHITWTKTSVTSVSVCVCVCFWNLYIFLCSVTRWEDLYIAKQSLCVCVCVCQCVPAFIGMRDNVCVCEMFPFVLLMWEYACWDAYSCSIENSVFVQDRLNKDQERQYCVNVSVEVFYVYSIKGTTNFHFIV